MTAGKDSLFAPDEAAMVEVGTALAAAYSQAAIASLVIYLKGDLGMGKTTLARGFIRHYGHSGAVKSPTYTLVEPYTLPGLMLYHFDLYRLGDAEELEYMGIRDYFSENSVCLVEWAERGLGVLPAADIVITITREDSGRRLALHAGTDQGKLVLQQLQTDVQRRQD